MNKTKSNMEVKINHHPEEEPLDAFDQLIVNELGQQARWRGLMQEWEQQQRRRRRMRLLPVFSNIASVAALMIMGLILQAFLPKTKLIDQVVVDQVMPKTEQVEIQVDTLKH